MIDFNKIDNGFKLCETFSAISVNKKEIYIPENLSIKYRRLSICQSIFNYINNIDEQDNDGFIINNKFMENNVKLKYYLFNLLLPQDEFLKEYNSYFYPWVSSLARYFQVPKFLTKYSRSIQLQAFG